MALKQKYRAPFTITHTCELHLFQKLLGWKSKPNLDFDKNKELQEHFIVIADAEHHLLRKFGKTKTKKRGTPLWVYPFCQLLREFSESWPNTFDSGGGYQGNSGCVVLYDLEYWNDNMESIKGEKSGSSQSKNPA